MRVFESIADRRVQAAREAGLFDNLPGAGKPIADLDRQRPAGWWATRLVRRERSRLKADELEAEVRAAMPEVWRLGSEADVRERVSRLNKSIGDYNKVTTLTPRASLEADMVVDRWKRIRRHLDS